MGRAQRCPDAQGALAEIIGQIERRADILRTLATQQVSATAWDLFSERLELRDDPTSQGFGQTSSSSIHDVLERFRASSRQCIEEVSMSQVKGPMGRKVHRDSDSCR